MKALGINPGHCFPSATCPRSLRLTWASGLVAMCQAALESSDKVKKLYLFTPLRPGSHPVLSLRDAFAQQTKVDGTQLFLKTILQFLRRVSTLSGFKLPICP